MRANSSAEIFAYAKWLTQACQAAGLNAEHHGQEVLVIADCHHLSERVICHQDEKSALRWYWSWGKPITSLTDTSRVLTPEDIDELVAAIKNVVSIQVRSR